MRVDDYRFYGKICLIFGIFLLVIGIAVAFFGIQWRTNPFTGETIYSDPYLGSGVAVAVIGVILIVASFILNREYDIKKQGTEATKGVEASKVAEAKSVPQPVGYCPFCGTPRAEADIYCKKCGKQLP